MPKILHTADLQLDASFGFLGAKGDSHRQQLRNTLRAIVDLVKSDNYDLLLIAGDLFDSNHPTLATITFVQQQLEKLAVPVCILPGNHDCYDAQSIYRREKFPANVHIFTTTPTTIDFPDLDLTVAGNPLLNNYGTEPVLNGLLRTNTRRWYIVMAHGNLQIPGLVENTSRPIKKDALAATAADYVALGDWHGFADYTQGKVKAFYPGAPEPTGVNQHEAGYVASINLTAEGVTVEKIRVGRTFTREMSLDVMNLDLAEIRRQISQHANENCMLSVTLSGMKAVDLYIDPGELTRQLQDQFYWLQIDDASTPAIDDLDATQYPETRVIGKYIRSLKQDIVAATDDRQRRIAEQALQIGVALLQGKEVL